MSQAYGGYTGGDVPATTGDPGNLALPWYGIGFGAAIKRFFAKYAVFTGRASRGEYWWVFLAILLLGILFNILLTATGATNAEAMSNGAMPAAAVAVSGIFGLIYLAILIPNLSVTVRRLHDTDKSGWFILIGLIPFVGGIILLILLAMGSNPAGARFDR
ncbi:DUF805 domain-containing protein [Naumannella cuiyingiana]|uniref:Uncharacterized membrane protein YhaH (DUF805 family) n=1 Tax=Naumannella cuiyingiana TaxID=1347891 RepID=A0A7Z0D9Z7_9ACTN|nr:DUF805 domain-containing protein [Naumannella cuiyingiana]NYI71499.1 uncharacterized membrane protein YhaH (DUF805 family) [Naumannella cuiyingiana]